MRFRALSFVFCCLAVLGATAYASAEPIVMKIGTATINDTQTEWMSRYKAAVERDSQGRIEVQIYPGSQLGTIPREIEDTQFGAIQGWVGPPEFLGGVDSRFGVLSAPGVFSSWDQATKTVLDPDFRSLYLNIATGKGLIGVGVWLAGDNDLFLRKPAHTLADLKNLKIRILAGPLQEATMHALGAVGVPMPLDQVAPALQQGAIDGIITNLSTAAPLKYYSSAPYDTKLGQPYIFSICVVSKIWYEKLPPDLQKIVTDDGLRVVRDFLPFAKSYYTKEQKAWTDGGGQFITLPPAEQKDVLSQFVTIAPSVLKSNAPALSVYDALLAARSRAR